MNWNNITLKQFLLIQEALKIEDETARVISLVEIVFGDSDIPLQEFIKKAKELSFLKDEIPNPTPVKKYKIEDREYQIDCLLGNISTAQYIDYTNYCKGEELAKIMAVFFIPKGHKYNDGYDMQQVIEDMNQLPITIVNGISFFFKRQFLKFIEIFHSCLIKRAKKMKLPEVKLIQSLKDLEFSLLS